MRGCKILNLHLVHKTEHWLMSGGNVYQEIFASCIAKLADAIHSKNIFFEITHQMISILRTYMLHLSTEWLSTSHCTRLHFSIMGDFMREERLKYCILRCSVD
jgi:hypothetical protein